MSNDAFRSQSKQAIASHQASCVYRREFLFTDGRVNHISKHCYGVRAMKNLLPQTGFFKAGAIAALVVAAAGIGAVAWRSGVAQSLPTEENYVAQGGRNIDNINEETLDRGLTIVDPNRKVRPDFFEESQASLDEEIASFNQERPAPGFGLDSGFMAWQPAVFRRGGFSVYVPMGVMTEELERIETAAGELEFDVFAVHSATTRFVVAYADRPAGDSDNAQLLDTLRDAAIEETEFNLRLETDTEVEGTPGRELQMLDSEESIAARIFVAEDRVYYVGVRQLKSIESNSLAATFLNSFNLL
ncbi:MAG: hypothetical protein AB4040_06970 [Synechococcus sp.]